MASIKGNIVVMGLSGMLDKQLVFYRRGETQFVRKAPVPRSNSSERQVYRQLLFKEAVAYARTAMSDPAVAGKRGQLKAGQRLFNVLISEYMRKSAV